MRTQAKYKRAREREIKRMKRASTNPIFCQAIFSCSSGNTSSFLRSWCVLVCVCVWCWCCWDDVKCVYAPLQCEVVVVLLYHLNPILMSSRKPALRKLWTSWKASRLLVFSLLSSPSSSSSTSHNFPSYERYARLTINMNRIFSPSLVFSQEMWTVVW